MTHDDAYTRLIMKYYRLPILLTMDGETPILFHQARRLRVTLAGMRNQNLQAVWFSNS